MSTKFESKGTIHAISPVETKKTFTFRRFVVMIEDGKFPQFVEFQSTRDAMTTLDGLSVGDEVTVEWNLKGREWRSPQGDVKYFSSLDAWRIVATNKAATKPAGAAQVDTDTLPF